MQDPDHDHASGFSGATATNAPTPKRVRPPKRLSKEQVEKLEHLIRQQEVTGLTDEAISIIVGTTRTSVRNHRIRIAAGLRHDENRGGQQGPVSIQELASRPIPSPEQAALERVGEGDEPLSPEQSLRLLSFIARSSPNANAQVAALRALEVLRIQIEAPSRLGPGDPLAEEDRIHRLALVMYSQGIAITRKALERAWPAKAAE